jgi:heme oxygenase (mycobilin-producing)
MSVVKINAIEVPEGMGAELERRFAARAGEVDKMDGFEEFMLLRPVEGETRYFVLTRWASEEAFQAWRNGQQFQRQHGQPPGEAGHGEAAPQQPVATGSALLSFDVVSMTAAPPSSSSTSSS